MQLTDVLETKQARKRVCFCGGLYTDGCHLTARDGERFSLAEGGSRRRASAAMDLEQFPTIDLTLGSFQNAVKHHTQLPKRPKTP